MQKFLIIRFSSIGDIVLTTPVVRSLKKAYPNAEIHYLTKPAYNDILAFNPYITQVHHLKPKLLETANYLKAYKFDCILDLHRNLRTYRLKRMLKGSWSTFPKMNVRKLEMVYFKRKAPAISHIVERYGKALTKVNAELDGKGLDFFIPEKIEAEAKDLFFNSFPQAKEKVLSVVLGASYTTKRWIPEYFVSSINQLKVPVLFIGGPDTEKEAKSIIAGINVPFLNAVGKYDVVFTAALMKQSNCVLTHDTGFMHIAAAFKMPVVALWGNTVPEMGMYPYQTDHRSLEVVGLSCRPCSKLGYSKCPKGHFKCMRELRPEIIVETIRSNQFN